MEWDMANPNLLAVGERSRRFWTKPFKGLSLCVLQPRVARSSQPWAGGRNPFGIAEMETEITEVIRLKKQIAVSHCAERSGGNRAGVFGEDAAGVARFGRFPGFAAFFQ